MKELKPYLTTVAVVLVTVFAIFRLFPTPARKLIVGA